MFREHGIKRLLSRVADFIYRTRVLLIFIIIIITELSAEALRAHIKLSTAPWAFIHAVLS